MESDLLQQDLQGKIIKRRTISGLILTENLYSPGLRVSKHYHNHTILGCVLRGSYTNSYNRSIHEVGCSTVMFCPAGEVHATKSDRGAHCFNLELEPGWVKRLEEDSLRLDSPATFDWSFMAWLGLRLYKEFNEVDRGSSLAIEGLTLEMIAEASRCRVNLKARLPRWLEQAREILHARFSDHLTIADVAREVCIHPVYLASTFRHNYRCSIGDYLRQLRVNFASRRLSDSDDSFAEIAQAAGFSDQSHFSRVFKRFTGMTPATYRAAFRRSCDRRK